MQNSWETLKETLRTQALNLGFNVAAFAAPIPPPGAKTLEIWLARGWHGPMHWMANHSQKRQDPQSLLPEVGVVMTLGMNYRPPMPDLSQERSKQGVLAAYSCNQDYHFLIKKRLKSLESWLERQLGRPLMGRVFVDTAPVLEKPLAQASGLGWQGKNTLLINRKFGCWLLLGEYFIPLPLPADPPGKNHCGRCRRCLEACPTQALDGHGLLDARRCIASITIESSDPIPMPYRKAMGQRIFGCDDCLTVCPWNRFAPPTTETAFLPLPHLATPEISSLAILDEQGFRLLFKDSSIRRAGRIRFLRNLAVVLGNEATPEAVTTLADMLERHPEALIRGHCFWGLGQIARLDTTHGRRAVALLNHGNRCETNPYVRQEIRAAQWGEPVFGLSLRDGTV